MSPHRSTYRNACFAILLTALSASCTSLINEGRECVRAFGDGEVRIILTKLGLVSAAYKASISWVECRYYIAIWELPVTPDTQKIIVLDPRGGLIERGDGG